MASLQNCCLSCAGHLGLRLATHLNNSISTQPPLHPQPMQVARLLVNMHNQVAAGDFSYVQQMREAAAQQAAAAAAAASQRVANGEPGADEDSSSEDEEGSDGEDAMDAEVSMVARAVRVCGPARSPCFVQPQFVTLSGCVAAGGSAAVQLQTCLPPCRAARTWRWTTHRRGNSSRGGQS